MTEAPDVLGFAPCPRCTRVMPVPTSTTALQSALSDLLRMHAPRATLLASVGEEVLRVRADATANVIGVDLVPPDDWFERGEMTWLTRDGALLGLLWSEDGQVPAEQRSGDLGHRFQYGVRPRRR